MPRKPAAAKALPAEAPEAAAEWVPLDSLQAWAKNPRKNAEAIPRVRDSLIRFGWGRPLVARLEDRELIVGHTASAAARSLADLWPTLTEEERATWHPEAVRTATTGFAPCRFKDISAQEAHLLAVADNKLGELAQWEEEMLASVMREAFDSGAQGLEVTGFLNEELERLIHGSAADEADGGPGGGANGSLSDEYGEPPFTVFDTRSGRWQERRKKWIDLGIQSEVGRGGNLLKFSKTAEIARGGGKRPGEKMARQHTYDFQKYRTGEPSTEEVNTGTSIFDPVLCELLYSWFSMPGALVLDPFAGGSVRGIVAAALGRRYLGVELRPEQVEANRGQWALIGKKVGGTKANAPEWILGDAQEQIALLARNAYDFVIACPPYMDLEVYSDDERDISNMTADEFEEAYRKIIHEAVAALKPNRFACFVVSEIREKNGIGAYRGLPGLTIDAFEEAGARYYNEGVLINSAGSLPIRVRRQFETARKLGRTHQNILTFVKGDPRKAAEACGKVTRVDWTGGEEQQAAGVTEWTGDEALAGEA